MNQLRCVVFVPVNLVGWRGVTTVDNVAEWSVINAAMKRYFLYYFSLICISEISSLASFCSWADWFESYLVTNPEDRYFRDEAHIIINVLWEDSLQLCLLVTFLFNIDPVYSIPHYNSALTNRHTRSEPRHDKTNKMSVCPAKTQISLGICPVWSGSLLALNG